MKLPDIINKNKSFFFILVIFGVLMLFKLPTDPDFGWHYKYGEYNFVNKTILKENIFSFTFPNYFWANSYWLAQIVIYLGVNLVGFVGFSLLTSLFLAVFLFCILGKSVKTSIYSLVIVYTGIIYYLSAFLVSVRPLYFSTIFILFLVYVLTQNKKLEKYLPFLFVLWANTHADYTLGIFIYGTYTAGQLYSQLVNKKLSLKSFFNISTIPLISLFSTLINPYTYKLWTTLFKETHPYAFRNIAEMTPLSTEYVAFFAFNSVVLSLVLYATFFTKKKKELWYIVCVLVFFSLAVRSQYFIRPFVLLSSFYFVEIFDDGFAYFAKFKVSNLTKKKFYFLGTSLLIFNLMVVIPWFLKTYNSRGIQSWAQDSNYPYDAVAYIKENNPKGNMFNAYNWGGYLIWQLPEYKTFVDGRMPAWREDNFSVFEDYTNMHKDTDIIDAKLEQYDIGWIFERKESTLVEHVRSYNDWKVAYEDETSVILIRSAKIPQ